MLFHWPVSYCLSEHTCRPSHTTQPWCAFGCTSRKILNTTDICLTAARGQIPAEFMRTRGSRALPTCAASRNRPIALPGELVCGRLYAYTVVAIVGEGRLIRAPQGRTPENMTKHNGISQFNLPTVNIAKNSSEHSHSYVCLDNRFA